MSEPERDEITTESIGKLLTPFLNGTGLAESTLRGLQRYLQLLMRWNARTNLTAIRDAEGIVRRHFGESLFLALQVRPLLGQGDQVLDFGSGAGFPGVPLQMLYPELRVVLAESQGKKAAFLREVQRQTGLRYELWDRRVEQMPVERAFRLVTLRAVDEPEKALLSARERVAVGGYIAHLAGETPVGEGAGWAGWRRLPGVWIPGSRERRLQLWQKDVPRGTPEQL